MVVVVADSSMLLVPSMVPRCVHVWGWRAWGGVCGGTAKACVRCVAAEKRVCSVDLDGGAHWPALEVCGKCARVYACM